MPYTRKRGDDDDIYMRAAAEHWYDEYWKVWLDDWKEGLDYFGQNINYFNDSDLANTLSDLVDKYSRNIDRAVRKGDLSGCVELSYALHSQLSNELDDVLDERFSGRDILDMLMGRLYNLVDIAEHPTHYFSINPNRRR